MCNKHKLQWVSYRHCALNINDIFLATQDKTSFTVAKLVILTMCAPIVHNVHPVVVICVLTFHLNGYMLVSTKCINDQPAIITHPLHCGFENPDQQKVNKKPSVLPTWGSLSQENRMKTESSVIRQNACDSPGKWSTVLPKVQKYSGCIRTVLWAFRSYIDYREIRQW